MTSDTYKDEGPSEEFFFQLSGTDNAPWEINRPQPFICKLVEQGFFQGKILDIGCGTADNAIYIATHANAVHLTAFDLVNSFLFFSILNKVIGFRYPRLLKLLVKKLIKIKPIFNLKLLIYLKVF
jgi:SAM-dependent methyltransferase